MCVCVFSPGAAVSSFSQINHARQEMRLIEGGECEC